MEIAMKDFSALLLYIPGIIIFLVGSGQVRGWVRRLKKDASTQADVVSCVHIHKKDKRDRDVYNYYNVMAEFTDPRTKHKVRQTFKSPNEYAVGQSVRIFWGTGGEKPQLTEKENEAVIHPLVMMIGGALLILLALFENQGREVPAMLCLTAVLIGGGASLLVNYFQLKRKNLQTVTAEIIENYSRQISKESKILKSNKFTYYPIVRYELDGKENIRRCNINSSSVNTFKVGETMNLYVDPATGTVLEKNARLPAAICGALLVIAGILAGVSILSVL